MQKSKSLSIKPSSNSNITNLSIQSNTNAVSRMNNLNFIFQTRQFKANDYIIEIIFPLEFVSLEKNLIKINGISKLNMNGFLNYELNGNKLKILNPFNQYFIYSDIHNLRVANIRNPYTTKKSGNFSFNIYDSTGIDLIYSLKSNVSYTPSAGRFLENLILPENLLVNKTTKYFFSFTTESYILKDSYLIIIFPSEIIPLENTDKTCLLGNLTGIISNVNLTDVKCSIVSLENKIIIKGIFFSDIFLSNNKFGFSIDNVKNPNFVKDSYVFTFSLNAFDGNAIDYFSGNIPIKFLLGNLTSSNVILENKIVNKVNTISFDLTFENEINENANLSIELPADFRFLDNDLKRVDFSVYKFDKITNDFKMQSPIIFDLTSLLKNNNAIFNLNFKKENFYISSNEKIKVKITNFFNPRMNKQVEIVNIKSFKIINNNNNNINNISYPVDDLNTAITLKDFEILENSSISLSPNESITGKLTSYNFSIKPLSRIFNRDYTLLILPSSIQVTQNTKVISLSPNLIPDLEFIIENKINENNQVYNEIKIVILINNKDNNSINYISESENILISLTNIINPYSLQPCDIPQIKIFNPENFLIESSIKKLILSIQNPNLLRNAIIKPIKSFIGESSDYLIEFTTTNPIFKDSQIKVFYPKQIVVKDSKCIGLVGIETNIICEDDKENRILLIKNGFLNDQMMSSIIKFKIAEMSNVLNPPNIKTDSFEITIENKNGFITEAIFSNLNLTFYCSFPCKSCMQDTYTCLSCEGTKGQILFNGTCVEKCPKGYFYNYDSDPDKNSCKKCNDKCNTCAVNNPDVCITCSEAMPLFILERNSCVNKCPEGFYADFKNMQCMKCDANCKSCANTNNNCLSCDKGLLLLEKENRCVTDCPQNTSIMVLAINNNISNTDPNNINNILNIDRCSSCHSSCQTCRDSPIKCLSCSNGYAFFEEKCISENECPSGMIGINGKCVFCDEKCDICKDRLDLGLCTKCKEGFILGADYKCYFPINDCEKGFYNSGGICYKCDSSCDTCQVEGNLCLSCQKNMYLQGRKCVEQCSEGYYKKSEFECGKCDSTCKTCVNDANNCLQCMKNMNLFIANSLSVCLNSCPDGYFKKNSPTKKRSLNDINENYSNFNYDKEIIKKINTTYKSRFLQSNPYYSKLSIKNQNFKENDDNIINRILSYNEYSNKLTSYGNDPNKSECLSCIKNCRDCFDSNNCIRCEFGFYLYNKNKCLKYCPENYYENTVNGLCELDSNKNTINGVYNKKTSYANKINNLYGVINNDVICKNCDFIYSFLFTFFLVSLLIFLIKCKYSEIHLLGSLLAFGSIFTFSLNIYFIKVVFNLGIKYLFKLFIIKFCLNYFLNVLFVLRLNFLIKKKDIQFSYWVLNNRLITTIYLIFGLMLDYKFIRLLYSRFRIFKLNNAKENCVKKIFGSLTNANFDDLEIINQPFKQFLILEIIFIDSMLFLVCFFIFSNFFFSPEIIKLSITIFTIYFTLLIVKIGELIIFKAEDDFYNQRKLTVVDVKPYYSNSDKINEIDGKNEFGLYNKDHNLNNLKNLNFASFDEKVKNKINTDNTISHYNKIFDNNNIDFNNENKLKKNEFSRKFKTRNSVCFNNQNFIGMNIKNDNVNYSKAFNFKYDSDKYNKSNDYSDNSNSDYYKYRLNNSGGVYEMEKYVNSNLSKEFNLYNFTNTNNNKRNYEEGNSSYKQNLSNDLSERDNYIFEYERKCKSLSTKKYNFDIEKDEINNIKINDKKNKEQSQDDYRYNQYLNNENNYYYNNKDPNNPEKKVNFNNENNKYFYEGKTLLKSKANFEKIYNTENDKNIMIYTKDKLFSKENNVESSYSNKKGLNENNIKNHIDEGNYNKNNSTNTNKIGFLKRITSSIKNIFPSTKKTQKIDYSIVQEENQVSCFNNKKINAFKSGGIGLINKLDEISIEDKENNKRYMYNIKNRCEIESTPNFNNNYNIKYDRGNVSSNFSDYNNIKENQYSNSNVSYNISDTHQITNNDYSNIVLMKKNY